MLSRPSIHFVLTIGFLAVAPAAAAVRYAQPNGLGSGDCLTWAGACSLSHAIAQAVAGQDQVWAKAGTYPPVTLKNGVKIIGGFAGTETSASQSNHTINVTVIDGAGTAQCVVDDPGTTGTSTLLRGFTIRNGVDSGSDGGGGMVLINSSALIAYCTFENNRAADFGGGVAVRDSGSPQFFNCIFRNNGEGGTLDTKGGGAAFIYRASPTFVNCLFHNNVANEGGAALVGYGTPTFINCTIVDNDTTVSYGGGVADQEGRSFFKNCILWGNTAVKGGGYSNQIFSGSMGASTAVNCTIQGGWPGTNILTADPLFANPGAGAYTLQSTSPCKNAGESLLLANDAADLNWNGDTGEFVPRDLGQLPRVRLGAVDMGAHEIFSDSPPGGDP